MTATPSRTRIPAEMTPAAIDALLSQFWMREQTLQARIVAETRSAERYGSDRRSETAAQRCLAMQAEIRSLRSSAEPLEAEFARRGGWSRYFLVTNSNGHVHRGLDCSTCFASTDYSWLVELADCDEAAMVEEFGEKACAVCFPDAPALPSFAGPGRRDREAIAARQAEKAARDAEKAAKAITAPDGSPLRVDGSTIATKVAASRALSEAVQSFAWYGPSHPSDFLSQIRTLGEALEVAGIEIDPIVLRASKKAAKEGAPFAYAAAEI